MNLNENEVNNYLTPFLGRYEDSFQQTWIEILESNPHTLEEITPIIKKVKNKAIREYMNRKYREESLYKPIGNDGDETFTLESILQSPGNEDSEDRKNDDNGLYKKMVDFLIGECVKQKNENRELRRRDIDLKTERLKLRHECLTFKRDRFESWKKLMEEKGEQKENRFRLQVQLQREKLEFRKEQLSLKREKRVQRGKYKRFLNQ